MVKPAITHNMTITLQQDGESGMAVKPLVVGEQVLVHTNPSYIPPHRPAAPEQDQTPVPKAALSLEKIAGFTLGRPPSGDVKLSEFTRYEITLLSNRYHTDTKQ